MLARSPSGLGCVEGVADRGEERERERERKSPSRATAGIRGLLRLLVGTVLVCCLYVDALVSLSFVVGPPVEG